MTNNFGVLTDYEDHTVRIDDKPIQMFDDAAKFCGRNHQFWKGKVVEYTLVDGKIRWIGLRKTEGTDIAGDAVEEAKRKAAGFGNGTPAKQEEKKDCTSSNTPAAPALKVVEGQITAIDSAAHTLTLKDRAGTTHEFKWTAPMNDRMAKLKQWWFAKITAEQSGEYWKVTAQDFFQRPADWPAGNHGGHAGGRPGYAPRNEKPMLYESVFKSLCEMFDGERDGKGKSWEENARRIWAMTEEIGDKMAAKAGVQ